MEIARFLEDFQNLAAGDEGRRKLISIRIPEKLLTLFKKKSESSGTAYQTRIISLMREWVASASEDRPNSLHPLLKKIISGGQTGVDRAALDVSIALGYACGGWCPKGRLAEDGPISLEYSLKETPSNHYSQRTEWNVRDADATLILTWGLPQGGTQETLEMLKKWKKPYFVIDFEAAPNPSPTLIRTWIRENSIQTLNIAGPRADKKNEIYLEAYRFLSLLLEGDPA